MSDYIKFSTDDTTIIGRSSSSAISATDWKITYAGEHITTTGGICAPVSTTYEFPATWSGTSISMDFPKFSPTRGGISYYGDPDDSAVTRVFKDVSTRQLDQINEDLEART